jgi:hexosaminidase
MQPAGAAAVTAVPFGSILPAPVQASQAPGVTHLITADTVIHVRPGSAAAARVGGHLADLLRPATGFALPVLAAPGAEPAGGSWLLLSGTLAPVGEVAPVGAVGAAGAVGAEGYQLDITADSVVLRAQAPAGLFAGVQTLRQLLPPRVDSGTAQPGPWPVAGGRIVDHPRFGYRGAMLDVARHFFPVATVQRYLDEIAVFKLNVLHLHLSDDQGWRLAIDSWPDLAVHGGSTAVGGDPGGYYTQDEFRQIVAYAAERYITVVPEIDMPGHTNAALACYPGLNRTGVAPPPYTGTEVGFSSLSVGKDLTDTFVRQVIGELAALTPGPFIHIGGDEAAVTTATDYAAFIGRVQEIVAASGKAVIGWHEVADASLLPSTVVQFWGTAAGSARVAAAAGNGTKVIMSPANHAYLDMKYHPGTPIGHSWAGYLDVHGAYGWDPGRYLAGVPEAAVLGVEAPLWTETVRTLADIEYLAFPRLPAVAELGWSPAGTHDLAAFTQRLAAQGPRWRAMGVNYHRSQQVPWPAGS